MKRLSLLLALVLFSTAKAQTKILSWNLENFGKSKTERTISYIANTLKDYDIVAIQEVVAGNGGAQAVARLADELNRKGTKWDYTISEPTTSSAYKTERYAFLWKTNSVIKIGKAWLEKKYGLEIEREPYFCTFKYKEKQFTLVSFHAITKSKKPETEIKYFQYLPKEYPNLNLIFMGDFNCPQSHMVFNLFKKIGYQSVFENQKTSLKMECKNNVCLASEFDNIWYNRAKIKISQSAPVLFYKTFKTLKEARIISDHIPIWMEFNSVP